jgi:hypothetical protein
MHLLINWLITSWVLYYYYQQHRLSFIHNYILGDWQNMWVPHTSWKRNCLYLKNVIINKNICNAKDAYWSRLYRARSRPWSGPASFQCCWASRWGRPLTWQASRRPSVDRASCWPGSWATRLLGPSWAAVPCSSHLAVIAGGKKWLYLKSQHGESFWLFRYTTAWLCTKSLNNRCQRRSMFIVHPFYNSEPSFFFTDVKFTFG